MKRKYLVISLLVFLGAFVLAACTPQTETVEVTRVVTETETVTEEIEVTRVVEGEVVTEQIEVTRVVEVAAEPEVMEPVTLEFYHWFGADLGNTTIKAINAIFQAENPNITIEFETADTGTFEQVINTRLSADDAPDLFGVFPGTKFHPQAEAGFLMDLNDAPWVDTLFDGAKFVSTYNGNVMTLPIDANVIGVIYNKQIFADLGLEVPLTWDEFLTVSEAIKESGVTPIALGLQSAWVTQLIPYAMAPSAIYRDNIDFDAQMYAGDATFVGSAWEQMMADYLDLGARGYFNNDALGTDYGLSTDLMASGEAAMLIQGNWAVAALRDKAPDLEWGMFPLPYDAGGDVWVPSAIGGTITISANTEYPEEARKYLEFWARPDIAEIYLNQKGAFPVSEGVNPIIDAAAGEMIPYLEVGSYPFLDQNWPPGVQGVMLEGIQSVFAEEITVEEMLGEMDTAWAEGTE
jgi:raffinose/stachyose/melibiose transport system substrate-binding protein